MSDEMQPAEIGRSLKRLEDSQRYQTDKLEEILVQATKTNGRVDALEKRADDHSRRLDGLARTRSRAADRPDVMTFGLSQKTIRIAVVIGIGLGTAVATIAASLLGLKLPTLP